MTETVLSEILRDAHRYAPGIEQRRPTLGTAPASVRRHLVLALDRCRDVLERAASQAGFTRRHHDPAVGAAALARILSLSDPLERTFDRLADEQSRRALIDVLKLRVLGPYHAPLAITPERFRRLQAYADRVLRQERATFEVSDPWFSPISAYRVPVSGQPPVVLHAHSVDVVGIFLLNQYAYSRGGEQVTVQAGDIVLDAGGCWGDTALYFASMVGPAGKVYTFEFDPENLVIMRTNLALNPELASRIEIVEQALWDRSGETLEFALGGRTTSLAFNQDARHTTSTITLDDFVESAGIERLDFVKMDVEGAELKVLAGGKGALRRYAPKLAIAAYHRDDDVVRIPEAIEGLGAGYRFFLDSFSPLEDETVLFARSRRAPA